jgi:hypothetical protein
MMQRFSPRAEFSYAVRDDGMAVTQIWPCAGSGRLYAQRCTGSPGQGATRYPIDKGQSE